MKAGVKVVDHPKLLEVPLGTIDQFDLEGHPLPHLAHERAGDVHEHGVLPPSHDRRHEQQDAAKGPQTIRHRNDSHAGAGLAARSPEATTATRPR